MGREKKRGEEEEETEEKRIKLRKFHIFGDDDKEKHQQHIHFV